MIFRVYRQVRKETVVGLEAEHVDSIATFLEETVVVLLHQLNCVLQEGLRVKSIRVKVERQDGLSEDAIKPESFLLLKDYLEDSDQDLRLALIVDECTITLVVCLHDLCKLILHGRLCHVFVPAHS